MSRSTDSNPEAEHDNYPEIRRQMVALIQRRRRAYTFTRTRPTVIRFRDIVNPETGLPLTDASMWRAVRRFLDDGVPLESLELRKPVGEKAWVMKARLAPNEPLIYVKLQILGSNVRLRSFHKSETSQ
ncbi:MAG: hypothetical protein OXE73_06100 [Gammaproteobacteria bacterium]|nr:hypothetical protein [Gammaproteobacteria bacterium]